MPLNTPPLTHPPACARALAFGGPQVPPRYTLAGRLGSGAYGVVALAHDSAHGGQAVAIKKVQKHTPKVWCAHALPRSPSAPTAGYQ